MLRSIRKNSMFSTIGGGDHCAHFSITTNIWTYEHPAVRSKYVAFWYTMKATISRIRNNTYAYTASASVPNQPQSRILGSSPKYLWPLTGFSSMIFAISAMSAAVISMSLASKFSSVRSFRL